MENNYHHNNLKKELIENAIKMISENGFESVSLRSLSKLSNVSHNAIYRHFENKEALIVCCQNYATDLLTNFLKSSVENFKGNSLAKLKELCCSYVDFYIANPTFYSSLYRNTPYKITFSLNKINDNYPPFELFRTVYCEYAAKNKIPVGRQLSQLVGVWSLVHGLTPAVISKNTVWSGNYKECIDYYFKGEDYEASNIDG